MRKGFTLVELLAVIVILSLLATLTGLSVIKIIKDAKNDLYNSQLKIIEKAARTWAADHIYSLPEIDSCKYITVKYLKKQGLLDSNILNFKNNTELDNNMYIKITKRSNGYNYEVDPKDITGCSSISCFAKTGDGTNIGDEIACATDSFYVISTDTDNIKMLAKYNLNIGNYKISTDLEGFQSVNAKGFYDGGESPYPGAIAYATGTSSVCHSCSSSYTCYNSFPITSILYKYKTDLIAQGVEVNDVSLIKKEEIEQLINGGNELLVASGTPLTLPTPYPWIYGTSYWTNSSVKVTKVVYNGSSSYNCTYYTSYKYVISSDGTMIDSSPTNSTYYGVRPVVTIPKSEIKF